MPLQDAHDGALRSQISVLNERVDALQERNSKKGELGVLNLDLDSLLYLVRKDLNGVSFILKYIERDGPSDYSNTLQMISKRLEQADEDLTFLSELADKLLPSPV